MVELFYSVVGQVTTISLVAVASPLSVLADLRLVGPKLPAPVSFHVMVVRTLLVVMILRVLVARQRLERGQVKVKDNLTLMHVSRVDCHGVLRLLGVRTVCPLRSLPRIAVVRARLEKTRCRKI
jgi:hypothetical protein